MFPLVLFTHPTTPQSFGHASLSAETSAPVSAPVSLLPVTTQQDTAYHGYGMLSMRRIAESYGGVMEVSCKDCLFSLDMTIPMRPAVEKSA